MSRTERTNHSPWNDGCYKRGHKGAAMRRKGAKVGMERANRHARKIEVKQGQDIEPKGPAKLKGIMSRLVYR